MSKILLHLKVTQTDDDDDLKPQGGYGLHIYGVEYVKALLVSH